MSLVTFAPLKQRYWFNVLVLGLTHNNKLISNSCFQFSLCWQKTKNVKKFVYIWKWKSTINAQEISSVCLCVSHLLLMHSFSSVVQELTCWSLSVSNIRLPRLTCREKEEYKHNIHIIHMLNGCQRPKTEAWVHIFNTKKILYITQTLTTNLSNNGAILSAPHIFS